MNILNRPTRAALIAALLLTSGFAMAAQNATPEAWERDEAWRASASVDVQDKRGQLRTLLKAGDSRGVLSQLQDIEKQTAWPAPARERLLFEFASELRLEPPNSVGEQLIEYLATYESRVWVPHEDHPDSRVPMFNIKGAAAGAVSSWSRQAAAFEGATLLATGGKDLVNAYLHEQDMTRRRGFSDALASATPAQLQSVSQNALKLMTQYPALESLAGWAALLGHDFGALEQLAREGHGKDMARLFRQSVQILDTGEASLLLQAALQNSSHETAALAIAELAPALKAHPATADLLLQTLGDPSLGSAAALALARFADTSVTGKLETIAASADDSLEVSRARLALRIRSSGLQQDVQP